MLARAGNRERAKSCHTQGGPEFFAVLVEAFFEKPRSLATQHPELYAELSAFFRVDPAARMRQVDGR